MRSTGAREAWAKLVRPTRGANRACVGVPDASDHARPVANIGSTPDLLCLRCGFFHGEEQAQGGPIHGSQGFAGADTDLCCLTQNLLPSVSGLPHSSIKSIFYSWDWTFPGQIRLAQYQGTWDAPVMTTRFYTTGIGSPQYCSLTASFGGGRRIIQSRGGAPHTTTPTAGTAIIFRWQPHRVSRSLMLDLASQGRAGYRSALATQSGRANVLGVAS